MINRHEFMKIEDNDMNIYLNLSLDIIKINEVISYCLDIKTHQINYIRLGRLDSKENFKKLSDSLSKQKNIYFYDYESLDLTLSEFKTLYIYLIDKGVNIYFLKEDDSYLPWLVKLTYTDAKIRSTRVIDAINNRREEGVILGRPRVESKIQKKIYELYVIQGLSMREVADKCDVSLGTVYKYAHLNKG